MAPQLGRGTDDISTNSDHNENVFLVPNPEILQLNGYDCRLGMRFFVPVLDMRNVLHAI